MKLSVIIVNYNVRAFLEQCLYSLRAALQGIEAEVWVVDNASKDDSVSCLQPVFTEVNWIVNTENLGFSKANNQALDRASGEFILFLNPDTLVPEDCLRKCISFMQSQTDAGALGIKMLDGGGHYLPESKRGYPALLTSFFKITGFHHIFPNSGFFARYYLGHLSAHKNNPVEVLAGAFMLVRKKVLDITGGFDERFFMYGEDIDLSYRINHTPMPDEKGYWKTWYFADSSIIHFKGESTQKGSLNYVLLFYKAMIQFVQKHHAFGPAAGLFRIFIYTAIAFKAAVSGFTRIVALFFGTILLALKLPHKIIQKRKGKHYIPFIALPNAYVCGTLEDFTKVKTIFAQHGNPYMMDKSRLIDPDESAYIGNTERQKLQQQAGKKVVIFCPNPTFTLSQIIAFIKPSKTIGYSFYFPGSNSIVGSNDKNKGGETFTIPCSKP